MRRIVHAFIVAILTLGPSLAAAAPAGALDPTFGTGGKRNVAISEFGTMEHTAFLRDSAGRIYLITSSAIDPETQAQALLSIVRLHHDGALDVSFGMQGRVTTLLPPGVLWVTSAAMQSDGRIVIGFYDENGAPLTSCRILRTGALDPAYGDAETPGCSMVGPDRSEVKAIALQPDGHILLVGETVTSDSILFHGVVARLSANGKLVNGFGDDGVVVLGGNVRTRLDDIAFAPDGDLILAGSVKAEGDDSDFLIVRLDGITGAGVQDFGVWSTVVGAFDAPGGQRWDQGYAVAVLGDGGIVAAGDADTAYPGSRRPALLKLTSTGMPDESFGPGGKRIYDPCPTLVAGCDVWANDIAVLSGERLAITGRFKNQDSNNQDFFAVRILANGAPDPLFGEFDEDAQAPGTTMIPFDLGGHSGGWPDGDVARWIAADGERLLLAGTTNVATGNPIHPDRDDFALARLDHGLDATFSVTPKPGPHGTLSPSSKQQVSHSDHAEFAVLPDAGYVVDRIEKGPGHCDGGMDGEVFVSAAVTQSCEVHVTFKRLRVFADSYE